VNVLILDVENTVTIKGKRKHLDPFEPGNTLGHGGHEEA
jgi:hypothetical protein